MPQNEWSGINSPLVSTDGRETTINSGGQMPEATVARATPAELGVPATLRCAGYPDVTPGAHPADTSVVLARVGMVTGLMDAGTAIRELSWTMLDAGYTAQAVAIRERAETVDRLMREIQSLATRCGKCGVFGCRCAEILA